MEYGHKRYGKKRVEGCYCEYNFSCGACLKDSALVAPVEVCQFHKEPLVNGVECRTCKHLA